MEVVNGMKVVLVIASDGFQHIEYRVPKKILEQAHIKVVTASNKPNGAIGKDGSTAPVDITLDALDMNDYDGIFFIGGPGVLEHLDTPASAHLLAQAKKLNKAYGAICVSVRILAKADVLRGKKATGWDGDHALRTILEGYGAVYEEGKPIVTDGRTVTATGPEAAEQFAQGIIRVLTKEKLA